MRTPGTGLATRAWGRVRRSATRLRDRVGGLDLRVSEQRRGVPLPPGGLIFTVANSENLDWFLSSGEAAASSLVDLLARNGVKLPNLGAVLDFGCGVGRVLRHWANIPGPEFHGTDYNPSLIEWCRNRLHFARFAVNSIDGRLAYADRKFDLAYAFSVFTHLDERLQEIWMQELWRVLKPGGHLVITTHGDYYLDQLSRDERIRYLAGQIVVRKPQPSGSNHCASFHPESSVRESLACSFEVVDFIPEGALGNPRQDIYLLRKPEGFPTQLPG